MALLDLLNHALNFVAPAAWVALLVTVLGRFFLKKQALAHVFKRDAAINFAVACVALVAGLWWFGRDGKMATYSAMALLCATSQWLLVRGWRSQ
jgi:hypothetical protein